MKDGFILGHIKIYFYQSVTTGVKNQRKISVITCSTYTKNVRKNGLQLMYNLHKNISSLRVLAICMGFYLTRDVKGLVCYYHRNLLLMLFSLV